ASDIVISVSKHNIPAQQKQGARKVRYIPNGVPAAWLGEPASGRSTALTIGWIGRCAEMKNPLKFFDVIDAFNRYGRTNARFLMVVCESGEPGLEQKVRVESRKYAHLEVVWNRSAKAYIDQMDALCITSHNESQPLVLLEALSKKVLPAGWRTGDVTREFGLILDPRATADKLAADIMELWHEPVKWERVVNRRFVKIKKHHTWEKIFARYDMLFSSLTETDII
ncbi:MAG TPA: glycosyltransferase, partial [Fodinibius sp.]|nr:glycosyltransferase [Fodinibius sp.]